MTRATKTAIASALVALCVAAGGAALLVERGIGSTGNAQTGPFGFVGKRGPGGGAGPSRVDRIGFARFEQCLRRHGITLSRGRGRPEVASPKVLAAMQACGDQAPARPPTQGGSTSERRRVSRP